MEKITANKTFFYGTPDNAVTHDTGLCKTAIALYCILENLANKNTHQTFPISIAKLAILLGRKPRTVCTHLHTLIQEGIISKIARSTKVGDNIWQLPSIYIVHGRHAPRYRNSPYAHTELEEELKITEGYAIFSEPKYTRHVLQEENLNKTLTRDEPEKRLTPNCVELGEALSTSTTGMYPETRTSSGPSNAPKNSEEPSSAQNKESQSGLNDCCVITGTVVEVKQEASENQRPTPKAKTNPQGQNLNPTPESQNQTQGRQNQPQTTKATPDPKGQNLNQPQRPSQTLESLTPETLTLSGILTRANQVTKPDEVMTSHDQVIVNPESESQGQYRIPKVVPEIMRPVAEYFLASIGRDYMKEAEADLLCELSDIHTPERIRKAIDYAMIHFADKDHPLSWNSFSYVYTVLKDQTSRACVKKKAKKSNKKASKRTPKSTGKQLRAEKKRELLMPLEEAERVIADFKPSVAEQLPVAWTEFLERLAAKNQEVYENYEASLPQDEDGIPIIPEYESEEEAWAAGAMTTQDYLRVRFPEVEDGELKLSSANDEKLLKEAMEIDLACATCTGEHCSLPEGYKTGDSRPIAMHKGKGIVMGYGGCIRCSKQQQADPEFEKRVENAGLPPNGANRTFGAFRHVSAEAIVAKARAILALQKGSNLILGGRVGSGKTHLATAIALEAMRAGRKVLVRSMYEMLDEICRAHQEHTDPFGITLKYQSVPCLVLDDWGKETTSDARLSYLYQVINYRYERGLQTIITTNASNAEGLKNKFNADKIDPLVSRLLANGEWVNITDAEDYRLKRTELEVAQTVEAIAPDVAVATSVATEAVAPVMDIAMATEPSENAEATQSEKAPQSNDDRAMEELVDAFIDNLCDAVCASYDEDYSLERTEDSCNPTEEPSVLAAEVSEAHAEMSEPPTVIDAERSSELNPEEAIDDVTAQWMANFGRLDFKRAVKKSVEAKSEPEQAALPEQPKAKAEPKTLTSIRIILPKRPDWDDDDDDNGGLDAWTIRGMYGGMYSD